MTRAYTIVITKGDNPAGQPQRATFFEIVALRARHLPAETWLTPSWLSPFVWRHPDRRSPRVAPWIASLCRAAPRFVISTSGTPDRLSAGGTRTVALRVAPWIIALRTKFFHDFFTGAYASSTLFVPSITCECARIGEIPVKVQ